jgi:UDP-glucose 4-epimerase
MPKKTKILVTGGAGYIGSITTAELIKAGYDVVVFDNLYQGHKKAVHPKAAFVKGDLAQPADIKRLFKKHPDIQGIMHFASYTLVGESMHKPLMYLRDNLVNAANLLEVAVQYDVKRFILSSTANLFDKPERIPIEPTEKIVPGSPYGESKFFVERLLYWFSKIYGLRYVCLRYFNACGDTPTVGEDHTPETHLIPIILQVALGQREKITIFGGDYPTPDGTCVRDYIHVVDLAQAHILAMEKLADPNADVQTQYNLGNGRGFSNLQVLETARKITGHAIPSEIGPRRAGDPATLIASAEAANEDLGWAPKFTKIEDIVQSAWDWHVSHPNGYRTRVRKPKAK